MNFPTIGIIIFFTLFLPRSVFAITIAEQTQNNSSQLNSWQTIQELGNNLTGTVQNFTFRVSTSQSNINQFDFTGLNSKIYDKDAGNAVVAISCVTNSADPLSGLSFTTNNVPSGYEDVTIDFTCQNYSFIPGHRYLIKVGNANMAQFGGKRILFGSATYSGTSNDYFTEGGLRYAFDNGSCNPVSYVWNSQISNSGCNIFTSPKDDLYFVLNNTSPPPPPPKLPIIFIPGIGGSELQASQDIIWSASDGHGGTFSHGYSSGEKIWVNQDEAAKLGDDDYFDVLRLKSDGQTSEATLSLTGSLTSFGYSDIDSFFIGMGYVKGTNFFVFPYDWRKDVRSTQTDLDVLIETAKGASGQPKVNLVVHSMGGLVARHYISDAARAAKVNLLVELGVPHIGTVDGLKAIIYGKPAGRQIIGDFYLGVPASEVKDIFQNLTSAFQLLPSTSFYSFYNNSNKDIPYPFRDDRDIDSNNTTGDLNYDQTKNLLSNLSHNMTVFGMAEQFHNLIDPLLNQANAVKIYEIVGSSQPTLGQIQETWWITWPINLIPKQDQIFINGDDTVPLYSASLKSDSQDLSGAFKIYYVEQKHGDLVSTNGTAMQTVKSILNDDNSLPVDIKDQKIALEGQQVSVDDAEIDLYDDSGNHTGLNSEGNVETNIPDTFYDSLGKTKHVFVKKKPAKKATAKIKSTKTTKVKIKIRHYSQDKINKTTLYHNVPITNTSIIQFVIDPNSPNSPTLTAGTDTILATAEATGSAALDQTAPKTSIQISGTKDSSGIYTGPVTITLTGTDQSSGILRIEYSLDNGQTVQTYDNPFTISAPGKTTIQFKSIDNLGNEEIPQTLTIEIAAATTSSSSSSGSSTSTSSDSDTTSATTNITPISPTTLNSSNPSISSSPEVLGIKFENPSHISDQINVEHILGRPENSIVTNTNTQAEQILGGLLIVSGGMAALASFGLIVTFSPWSNLLSGWKTPLVKPFPK